MSRRKKKSPTDELPPDSPPPVVAPSHPVVTTPPNRWWLRVGLTLIGVTLGITGLISLGNYTRDYLQREGQYRLAPSEIQCNLPPSTDRPTFLKEVQFLTGWPDELPGTDAELTPMLTVGFERHPWVQSVKSIQLWPRPAQVALQFRTPVLAIESSKGTRLAVDRAGILLPANAPTIGLVRLSDEGLNPPAPPGNVWDDAQVRGAAKLADRLAPYQARFEVRYLIKTKDGWRLQLNGDRPAVLWGNAPDSELSGEASAERKLQRLTEWLLNPAPMTTPTTVIDLRRID